MNDRWLPRLDALMAEGDGDQRALDVDLEREVYGACGAEAAHLIKAMR